MARPPVPASRESGGAALLRAAALTAVIAATVLASVAIHAIEGERLLSQYVHHTWTNNEGLPQDSVNAIAQTPDGYLWLATQEGIARFDGSQFTTFDSRNTAGVVPNVAHTLFVDRRGRLWAGGGDGILRHDGKAWIKHDKRNGWPGISGKSMADDAEGNLWVGMGNDAPTEGRGLVRFRDGQARLFTTRDGLSSNQVYGIACAPDGAVWVGTRNGLNVLRQGTFTSYGMADGLPDPTVREVLLDREGTLWLGTPRGLARMRDGRVAAVYTKRDGLPDDDVRRLIQGRNGVIWIATARGLAHLRKGRIEAVTNVEGLAGNHILSIYEDRESNLWAGVQSRGLHRLRGAKFTPFGPPEGMQGESVHAVAQDRSGRVWVGAESAGLSVSNGTRFTRPGAHLAKLDDVRALLHASDGTMWIGDREGLHRDDGKSVRSYGVAEGLPSPMVRVITQDRGGRVLIGTGDGLARFDGTRFTRVPLPPTAPRSIMVLHSARNGRLWVGGADGLGYLEGDRYTPLRSHQLPEANVYAAHEDPDGTLWFTTWSQGLYRVGGAAISRIREADGSYDDAAWSIVDDGIGNFWIGTNRGIFRVSRRELNDFADKKAKRITYMLFGTADGMRKRETNAGSPSAIRSRDGRLWFGTTGGLVTVDPKRLAINMVPPHVVITGFTANGATIDEPSPSLAPGTRDIQIDYAAPSLVAPEKVRYRYRLDGYDRRWVEAGSRRQAFYTNIDPRKYRFRVIAANEDGIWNQRGASIEFTLRPHFYQTRWFLPLLAVVLVLCGFGLKSLIERIRAIRRAIFHDALTGLPNRRLLMQRADAALSRATRRGRSIAILYLDLDGFKEVNDLLGHITGDKVLEIVSSRFRRSIAEVDTVARLGGDEFAVLIPDLDDEGRAAAIARRVIDTLRDPIAIGAERVKVGVSIGIALHPFDGRDVKTIIKAADRAMYRAKESGGNAYEFNAENEREQVTVGA